MGFLEMYQGDDERHDFSIKNPDASAANLTGWTLWFTAYPSGVPRAEGVDDADALLLAHWVAGGASLNMSVASLAAGVVVLDLPAASTKLLTRQFYDYDLQRRNAAGRLKTIDRGTIQVTLETTRRSTV